MKRLNNALTRPSLLALSELLAFVGDFGASSGINLLDGLNGIWSNGGIQNAPVVR